MLSDSDYELLVLHRNAPQVFDMNSSDAERKRKLVTDGFLAFYAIDEDVYTRLLPAGVDKLLAYEQFRENCAAHETKEIENEVQRIKERKQDRRDKWLIGIISACGGSVLTLGIEHFDKLSIWLAKLFH